MNVLMSETNALDPEEEYSIAYDRGLILCKLPVFFRYVWGAILVSLLLISLFFIMEDSDFIVITTLFNTIQFPASFIYAKWAIDLMNDIYELVKTFKHGILLLRSAYLHPAIVGNDEQLRQLHIISSNWFSIFMRKESRQDLTVCADSLLDATRVLRDSAATVKSESLRDYLNELVAHVRSTVLRHVGDNEIIRSAQGMNTIFILLYLLVLMPVTIFAMSDHLVGTLIASVVIAIFMAHPRIWIYAIGSPFQKEEAFVHLYTGHLYKDQLLITQGIEDKLNPVKDRTILQIECDRPPV